MKNSLFAGATVIEITVHQVQRSANYKDGLKWGLICVDRVSGKKVLMDNHHPKGPHIHIDNTELPYEFMSEDKLIEDFKSLVFEHLEIKI